MLYFAYSDFLKEKYGEKVYKAPIHLPFGCPNRDGTCGSGGCIFCPEIGTGFENLPSDKEVREQLKINMDYIGSRYHANKFIAYFQNYTNTYCDSATLSSLLPKCLDDKICEISFSTRPDSITAEQIKILKDFSEQYQLPITIELGLQSVNYKTLKKINRGHSLAEFIDAAGAIKAGGLSFSAHLILNLPWDEMDDVIESAKILSVLGAEMVKLHSLYIVKGTKIAEMYENKEFIMPGKDDYFARVGNFLCYLDPKIAIGRLFARAPAEDSLFVTWNTSWRKLKDELISYLLENNLYQGKYYTYRNGAATRKRFR